MPDTVEKKPKKKYRKFFYEMAAWAYQNEWVVDPAWSQSHTCPGCNKRLNTMNKEPEGGHHPNCPYREFLDRLEEIIPKSEVPPIRTRY